MKKTRSEWGSNEDWDNYDALGTNKFEEYLAIGIYKASIGIGFGSQADTREEARRLAVEKVCSTYTHFHIPWRPDFDLSTVEGCKEAIKECGYNIKNVVVLQCVPAIAIESERRLKYINTQVKPTLEQWQEAAQFAIDNHEQ